MKQIFMLLIMIFILVSCSEKSIKENKNVDLEKPIKVSKNAVMVKPKEIKLKEETPPLKTCKIQLGDFKMGVDGYSLGQKTELTELLKQLNKSDCDIIEIKYGWTGMSSGYAPAKIVYNRNMNNLKQIYLEYNVIEEYKNVKEDCLKDFLKKGNKLFWKLENYCDNVKYDFNNREMKHKAIGTKPEQSNFDGSVSIVKNYIKSKAKDASSIKFIEWSKVTHYGENWIVRCKYKGSNSFGGVVTENVWFYIQANKVVDTKIIE